MQQFTGSEVLFENEYIKFHRFSRYGDPVFVVPPHAGRHGNICQNLIDSLVGIGKAAYAYELLPATRETGGLSVHGLVEQLDLCMDSIATVEPIDVLGVCQGGWLSSIYAALHPDRVNRLALFAAPINTKTGEENIIEDYCRSAPLDAHKIAVTLFGGIQPGFLQWTAFAMANPRAVFIDRYVDQAMAIFSGDFQRVDKLSKNNSWYDSPQDLAGTWFIQAMEHHFMGNKLYEGTWKIAPGITPKLEDITCPVYVYAGGDDDITHPEQARGILDKVSSGEKRYTVFKDAGHTAVFARPSCIHGFIDQFYGGE